LNRGEEYDDPDKDCMKTLEEYLLRTDPTKFEANIKHRLMEEGYSSETTQAIFDQLIKAEISILWKGYGVITPH